ncbi:hypothetical protein HMPREF1051_1492, partial [Neisseria sicca VK64]
MEQLILEFCEISVNYGAYFKYDKESIYLFGC